MLDALDATDSLVAQRLAAQIQPSIDAATAAIAEVSQLLDDRNRIGAVADVFVLAAERAARERPVDGVLDLAAWGREYVEKRLPGTSLSLEEGARAAIIASTVEWFFDHDDFWALVDIQRNALGTNRQALEGLTLDSAWQSHWRRVTADAMSVGPRLMLLLGAAEHARAEVHAVLAYCREIQEGLAKLLMATTRYVGDPNLSFEQFMAQGPSALAEWCRAHGLPLHVFSTPSRNACAHDDWSLENQVVTLCPLKPPKGGPVQLGVAELVDHAIQLAEVSLAMYFGTTLGVHDVEALLPDVEEPYGPRWTQYVEWLLLASGWSSAVCSETGVNVELRCAVRRPVRWIELFSALAYAPAGCGSVLAYIDTAAGVRVVTVPVDLVHKQRQQDGEHSVLWLAALMHRCAIDDQPALGVAGLRKLLAAVALKATTDVDHVRGIKTLRGVRAAASDAGDGELARLAARAQGWKVSIANKEPRDAEELRDLTLWAAAKVDSPEYI